MSNAEQNAVDASPALKRLRQAVDVQRDIPAINSAATRIAVVASRNDSRVQDLLDIAYADPGLVLRLVRVANGSAYGNRDRTDVVQLNRAITLIGMNQTRAEAKRLVPIKDKVNPNRLDMARDAIGYAAFASRFARALLDTRNPIVSDEGAITTLIACLPDIIMSLHAPHELAALRFVQNHYPAQYEHVNRELMTIPMQEIGAEVVERWAMPRSPLETIQRTTARPTPAIAGRDWLHLGVGLALSVMQSLKKARAHERTSALQATVRRYSSGMSIDSARLDALIEEVAQEAIGVERSLGGTSSDRVLTRLLGPHLRGEEFEPQYWESLEKLDATGMISQLKGRASANEDGPRADDARVNAVGKPVDGAERLSTLIAEVTNTVAVYSRGEHDGEFAHLKNTPYERVRLRVIPMVLRGLLDCLGYDKVVWFEHRAENEDWIPSSAAGARVEQLQDLTRTRVSTSDLFGAVIRNGVDVHIADCTTEKIAKNLPTWFKLLYPSTRSFLIVPVRCDDETVGFIVADRACTDPIGLSDEELQATRQLRDQLSGLLAQFPKAVSAT